MLVLGREPSQSIQIGEEVTVSVVSVHGDKVRLGISAPRTLPVVRTELLTRAATTPQAMAPLVRAA